MKLHSEIIKETAQKNGFALCGIAKAEPLTIEKERFEKALAQNYHAQKPYLERDIDRRFVPELLLRNCKSVVVCGFNYNAVCGERLAECNEWNAVSSMNVELEKLLPKYKISQHAQIKDYHIFMKEKLEALAKELQDKNGSFNYKTTVDSSTISEKAWAVKAGIGYYGKNGIIQTPFGSFVFLGILLIDKEVDIYDTQNQSSCGNCNKCITACPTQAIVAPYYVNCNQCITHLAQNNNEAGFTFIAKYGWIIACDICQNVCPNNMSAPVNKEAVEMRAPFLENKEEIFNTLTPESFEKFFKDTVFYKFKYEGLKWRVKDFTS
jgi:epoxyqueuosine reductase